MMGLKTRANAPCIVKTDQRHLVRNAAACLLLAASALILSRSATHATSPSAPSAPRLELARPVRPWEFLPVAGTRAALFGNESGRMEAWVYPLKLLRELRLQFHTEGRVIRAETLARTIHVRPESATITYSSDTFAVHETFFVPENEPGAVILLDVQTEQPLEIEARFLRDFQLEWPASIGGSYISWDPRLNAFSFGEETRKYAGLVGSATASDAQVEYQTNYSESPESGFRLGVTNKGKERRVIVMAGSVTGPRGSDRPAIGACCLRTISFSTNLLTTTKNICAKPSA